MGPAPPEAVNVLLLEDINDSAVEYFRLHGFQTFVGVRSKTRITEKVIKETNLIAVGCFCVGTDQTDLTACSNAGIPVFNTLFQSSRSVAELTIAEIISLARRLPERWSETTENREHYCGSYEVRDTVLGIIGYGRIGHQVGVLAEALAPTMPVGNVTPKGSLEDVLTKADFVTLHVPETPDTVNFISREQFSLMKNGAYLINNARGRVVDIPALIEALKSGRLAGAALDTFPAEPRGVGPNFNNDLKPWSSELCGLPNVILTPHIGAATEEAQRNIGSEVAAALTRYIVFGQTTGSVQYPGVALGSLQSKTSIRLCHTHVNKPGVLKKINTLLSDCNVEREISDSKGNVAYVCADVTNIDEKTLSEVLKNIADNVWSIRTRVIYPGFSNRTPLCA